MTDFPLLHTDRLDLREITPADAPALFAIHSQVQAMRWYGVDALRDMAEAQQLVQMFAKGRLLASPATRWGLCRRGDDHLLGTVGLFKWNRGWRSAALGYELATEAQGRGLMREALGAVMQWGVAQQAIERFEASVHPANLGECAAEHSRRGLG
jgi:ribosomal-protein-alanine N-acetyltransferase